MNAQGPAATRSYEMATVLFIDIVRYSLETIDLQTGLLTQLQQCVQESSTFQQTRARDELICLPTGDGMALVFVRDPVCAVRTALDIAASVRSHPQLRLRIGVHTGPVSRHADIKNEINVVGGGINMAQRVMDCGDEGHILLSRTTAEILEQMSGWQVHLQDLGTHEVKHGIKIQIYNFCNNELGNPALPRKIGSRPDRAAAPNHVRARSWALICGFAIVLTFATRLLFNNLEATRETPLNFRETLFVFSLVLPIVAGAHRVWSRFWKYHNANHRGEAKA